MKVEQRLLDLVEQPRRIAVGSQGGQQTLLTEQLVVGIAALHDPIGKQQKPIARRHRIVFELIIQLRSRDDAQR